MVGQMIQNILVYVVMINVLEGLVSSESFREIFRFVGGLILIVLCVSPVLSKISDTDKVGQFLQERLFQEDMDQLNIETKLAEGSFEKIMLKQCKEDGREGGRRATAGRGKTQKGSGRKSAVKKGYDGTGGRQCPGCRVRGQQYHQGAGYQDRSGDGSRWNGGKRTKGCGYGKIAGSDM